MQGRLREGHLTVTIETVCAHSSRSMTIAVDSDMKYSVSEDEAEPLVFMPQVDWETFAEPNIIDAY